MNKELYEIFDASWSLRSNQNLAMVAGYDIDYRGKRFHIVARNCELPATNESQQNTVILREVNSQMLVFTQEQHIRPIICSHCLQTIKR